MSDIRDSKNWGFNTKQVQAGQEHADPATGARCVPIYQSASYAFDSADSAEARFALREAGSIYSRLGNPTNDVLEARVAALEGGSAALAVASGTAAIVYAIQAVAQHGEHIVAVRTLYGGSYNLFANTLPLVSGVTTTFVESDDYEGWEAAIQDNTKALYIEIVGNPNSNVTDIERIAEIAHRHGLPLIVDSTFTPPYLIKPFEHGADVVIHSATKFFGGHGSTIGGLIVDGGKFDWSASGKYPWIAEPNPSYHGLNFYEAVGPAAFAVYCRAILLRDGGASLSAFDAFLLLQGIETLSLRVERHVKNALEIVQYLDKHPQVERVHHPSLPSEPSHEIYKKYFSKGAGSIFTFDLKGGRDDAKKFIDNLPIFSDLANVADVKSLVIHPASTTHSQLSEEELYAQCITPSTIRLSIGIEDVEDLKAALDVAFEAIK